MNPKVSIIVPVYKVEKYIEKCSISLFRQTFSSFEIIFIDDASPDNSISLIKRMLIDFPDISEKVKIISNTKNTGLLTVRKTGIDIAKGNYILFVDGDDYIEHDTLEVMYKATTNESIDIVVCDMLMEYSSGSKYYSDYVAPDKTERIIDMIQNTKSTPSLCNKLIRRSLFTMPEMEFNKEIQYMEDRYLSLQLVCFAQTMCKIDRPFYHYIRYNSNSITNKITRKHVEDIQTFWEIITHFLRKQKMLSQFQTTINLQMVHDKHKNLIEANNMLVSREYRDLYLKQEKACFAQLTVSQKFVFAFLRLKFYAGLRVLRFLLLLKQRIHRIN